MDAGAAQAWFVAGTIPLILAGALHVAYTLVDTVRPRFFAPIDRSVQPALEGTGIRLVGKPNPSLWRVFVLSLRFWFYGPVLITGAATACFTIATVLSA